MRLKASWAKKLIFLVTGITVITVMSFPILNAQTNTSTSTTTVQGGNTGSTTEEYLYNIMQNTYGILIQVNNLPVYMTTLTNLANAWMNKDDSTQSSNLQSTFGNLSNFYLNTLDTRLSNQNKILTDLFQKATPQTMDYANDLTYQSLLGMPYFSQDPRNPPGQKPPPFDPPYNYLKNASGINLIHVQPAKTGWSGSSSDQNLYASYYTTIMAAQSFNAWVLSGPYAEYLTASTTKDGKKQPSLSDLQNELVTMASSSDWFSQVASETIGIVLRQILMFESQAFLMLTQLVQLQKQLLTAQAITNTLLIATSMGSEQTLLNKAASAAGQ